LLLLRYCAAFSKTMFPRHWCFLIVTWLTPK